MLTFEFFQEKESSVKRSLLNLKTIFGGTEHPMSLYKRFRGHEPSPEALLEGYYKSQYEFLFQNRGSNVSVFFIKRKRPSATKKIGML
jgi:hypothetical protein